MISLSGLLALDDERSLPAPSLPVLSFVNRCWSSPDVPRVLRGLSGRWGDGVLGRRRDEGGRPLVEGARDGSR